ncbi:hypothetical protein [Mycoplasma phocimorsus]|uniref:hypothetical protein n=1 Tax=Mycoplasma phocimorsus TaxID=3045839 RepID=UPI0024BFE148|nr:hypothetical protein [Mycoplasma phocimorsus]MDJ1646671.1 hypothetical protein [Mycoplasma phocimorsus]
MKKNRFKLFFKLLAMLFIFGNIFLSSCNKNFINKNSIILSFKKNKNNNFLINTNNNNINFSLKNLFEKSEETTSNNLLKKEDNKIIEVNSNNLENKLVINGKNDKLIDQLFKEELKNKKNEKKYKIITISFILTSSIITGIAVGLGTYFGIKNFNSDKNQEKKRLENILNEYKLLIKDTRKSESLINVLNKILSLVFEKNFPKIIYKLLKETRLNKYLQDFEGESQNLLIEKLKNIEAPTKDILNKLLNELIKINVSSEDSEDKIIKQIKSWVVDITRIYLPKTIKNILDFFTVKSNVSNQASILSRIFQNILENYNINFDDILNISNIFYTYSSLLINPDNDLIDFLITKFSDVLKNYELTFDIRNDFYNIINKLISELLADEDGLSIIKIFDNLIPRLLKIIKIQENKTYVNFVNFLNNIFNKKDSDIGKVIYSFFNNSFLITEKKSNNKTILLPKFKVNLNNLFLIFKKRNEIQEVYKKFLDFLFEPLVIELKNGKDQENAKKAIFRLVCLLSFIYYKYIDIKNHRFFEFGARIVNNYDPINFFEEFIKNLLHKHGIQKNKIENILGKKSRIGKNLFLNKFEIFKLLSEKAKYYDNNINLSKILEDGYYIK